MKRGHWAAIGAVLVLSGCGERESPTDLADEALAEARQASASVEELAATVGYLEDDLEALRSENSYLEQRVAQLESDLLAANNDIAYLLAG